MTTELTKAAQRVLDAYDALDKLDSFIKLAHEMAALRALTQRPAAQTEREAFEAWYAEDANKQTGKPGWFTPKEIAELRDGDWYGEHRMTLNGKWAGWQARASLPAPQQATPEERHLTVTTNRRGDAVMVSWQDAEHRILEVVWEREQATPDVPETDFGNMATQQATPDPDDEGPEFTVSDPDLNHLLNLAADMAKGRCNHDTGMAWLQALEAVEARLKATPPQQAAGEPVEIVDLPRGYPVIGKLGDICSIRATDVKRGDILYTHPAPGVPEVWTDEQCLEFMCVALRHVEYKRGTKGPTCDDVRLGVARALAAAQAKGGEHE